MTHAQAHESEAPGRNEPGAGAATEAKASDAVSLQADRAAFSATVRATDAAPGIPLDTAEPALTTRLDAWRARQPASADPLGTAFIEHLARRAEAQPGSVRRLLEQRLNALIAAHEARMDTSPAPLAPHTPIPPTPPTVSAAPLRQPLPRSAARTALAALVGQLARQSTPPLIADRPSATDEALASLGGPPDLKAMGYFRSTWSRLSAERRLTQSLARVPDKAGPLNAQHLVHQTLAVMRELSPGYLNHFLDHADTLMWLERVQSARPDEAAPARGAGAKGKAPARKAAAKRSRPRGPTGAQPPSAR